MGTEYSKTTCEPETQVETVRNVDPTASSVRYMVTPNHENRVGCVQSIPELSSPSRNDCDSKSMATNTCWSGAESRAATVAVFSVGTTDDPLRTRTPGRGRRNAAMRTNQAGSQHHILGEQPRAS